MNHRANRTDFRKADAAKPRKLPEQNSHSHTACPEDCFKLRMVFWLLVFAQFVVAAAIVFFLKSAFLQWWTAAMAIFGIAFGIWAILCMNHKTLNVSPKLRKSAALVVSGPYRFVRHPMYTALLVFCGAYVISDNSTFGWLLWAALAFILSIKIVYEEGMLKRRFPEYTQYANAVKRVIPFVL